MRATIVLCALLGLTLSAQAAYDRELVLRYLEYTAAAFCDSDPLYNAWPLCTSTNGCDYPRTEGFNVTAVITGRRTGTFSYIGFNAQDRVIVAAWRGTSNKRMTLQDLRVRFIQYDAPDAPEGALVHTGFNECYFETADQTVAEITRLKQLYPDFKVIATGHSLGGAIATIAALDLASRGFNATGFTYGAPRIGNQVMADYIHSWDPEQQRVVAYYDVVPQVLPNKYNYFHVPQEILILPDLDTIRVCDMSGEDPTCQNSVPKRELFGDAHQDYLHLHLGSCHL